MLEKTICSSIYRVERVSQASSQQETDGKTLQAKALLAT
jgi:hypothetical protein